MSSASRLIARRRAVLRPWAMRYPRGTMSMPMSTSSAPARPIMSAPTPRDGSSTRCGSVCSSPTTTSAACRGSAPGQDPIPVAPAKTLTCLTICDGVNLVATEGAAMSARAPPSAGSPLCAARPCSWRGAPTPSAGRRCGRCPASTTTSRSAGRRGHGAARTVADARDHRRRRGPDDHPVDGRQVPRRHRSADADGAAAVRVGLRRDADLRARHRGVPQDDVPEPTRGRAHLAGRRGLPRHGDRPPRLRRPCRAHRPMRHAPVPDRRSSATGWRPTMPRIPGPAGAAATTGSSRWCWSR